jgi:hypothetical protein
MIERSVVSVYHLIFSVYCSVFSVFFYFLNFQKINKSSRLIFGESRKPIQTSLSDFTKTDLDWFVRFHKNRLVFVNIIIHG